MLTACEGEWFAVRACITWRVRESASVNALEGRSVAGVACLKIAEVLKKLGSALSNHSSPMQIGKHYGKFIKNRRHVYNASIVSGLRVSNHFNAFRQTISKSSG